jgi:radical SAM superfamily enzyme YgiQ (UPF0313 family)
MTPPLSILYPGAYAARRGHQVEYFDARWDGDVEFVRKLEQAEVVGVSSMSGYQLGQALGYLKRAHECGKTTIMGGVHCTLAPKTCINEPYVDYLVIGEGEETLVDLLDNLVPRDLDCPFPHELRKSVPGTWTRTAGYDLYKGWYPTSHYTGPRPIMSADKIESPIDDQTMRYFELAAETSDVMLPASRGCPNKCGFCYNAAKPEGGKWQPIPLETWLKDLDRLLDHGIDIPFLQIGDDWLGAKARIFEIGEALASRSIQWHLSIRANQVDTELVSRLSELWCEGVSIGIESGSEAILKVMNKRIKVEDSIRAATLLARYCIKPLYYFILGTPTETPAQMRETMDLADRLYEIHKGDCSIAFFGFDPLIGTPLYKLAESLGQSVPKTLDECCNRERSKTPNPMINAVYYIAGLTFHRRKDKTGKNFPGVRRLLILPFELLCVLRWKMRFFSWFGLERRSIQWLLAHASKRR